MSTILPPTHATGAGVISLSEVLVPYRQRTDDENIRIKIEEKIVPSIQEHGLIHPILIAEGHFEQGKNIHGDPVSSNYKHVAGWSRLTAFKLLGYNEIPYNTRQNLPEHERIALELEENMNRNAMSWQDEVKAIARIHQMKSVAAAEEGTKWGMRQMGAMLGHSMGYVNEAITVAKLLNQDDEELLAADSLVVAKKIISQRKEDFLRAELQRRVDIGKSKTVATMEQSGVAIVMPSPKQAKGEEFAGETKDEFEDWLGTSEKYRADVGLDLLSSSSSAEPQRVVQVDLSSRFFNGDSLYNWEVLDEKVGSRTEPYLFSRFPNQFFDLIYTDIPFGIDMENLQDIGNISRVEGAHDVDENLAQMPLFLKEAYRTLKDKSYLLFWYDIKHQEKLVKWGEEVGFQVQPYPLIWLKTHPCRTRAPQCWWTKDFEYVMVMRKGMATLSAPQQHGTFACSGAAERKLQLNPFSKPFEFSKWLLSPLVKPGMKTLDCYAGGGSLVRAMLNLGCDVYAFEKEETHFNEMIEGVKSYYNNVTNGKVEFI